MKKENNKLVSFNETQVKQHSVLKQLGIVSQDFSTYVKTGFHEKVDKSLAEYKKNSGADISHSTIEKLMLGINSND